jgi:poly-gamma-glutamate synthesis protein (capsule biosynthesis protein)
MKIALLGDIALYGKYSIEANKDIYQYFKKVSDHLKQYDHVIGNLETPFITGCKPKVIKSACIGAEDENIKILNYLNIDIVNLANNHICDFGEKAYLNTKKLLKENKIKFFGIENQQIILQKNHTKLALHGYCAYNTNPSGIYGKLQYGVNALSIKNIEKQILNNHKLGLYNIVSIHSGQEHVNFPSYEDIKMARKFAKIAPYVYYGHHPHVMQGLEKSEEAILAYSLGNFCFDDVYTEKSDKPLIIQSKNNKTAFILELEFEGNKIIMYKTIPIYLGKDELILGDSKILKKLNDYSSKLQDAEHKYTQNRNSLIEKYILERKELRNFKWYIKRLNYKSAIMIYNSKQNIKKQYENVTKYLS